MYDSCLGFRLSEIAGEADNASAVGGRSVGRFHAESRRHSRDENALVAKVQPGENLLGRRCDSVR
jgi:hypothetical protein